ncbi:MAG TPA: hypothetical protein VMZ91_02820 [Candidatus Paceibacterota bacterium]|nr:hypothetical protein [Candidatus Paceibacterota bacterium]
MNKVYPNEVAQVFEWMRNGADFMFIPSSQLIEMVVRGEHPSVKSLPDPFKYVIMQNKPIKIEGKMALDYYKGQLDNSNTFILDHGDIKVIPSHFKINKGEIK